MKRIVLTVVWTVVLLVFLALAFAQETGPEEAPAEQPSYDYANNNNYQNPDFYRDPDSDPSQWDWTQVNWAVFDFERADVYDVPEFYQSLPIERYSDLNYRLVPDFALITDHSLIDGTKYVQDFGCGNCQFAAGDQGSFLVYTEEGRVYHTQSLDNVFVGDFGAQTQFVVTEDGIEVLLPAETVAIAVPERGRFMVNTEERALEYLGHTVSGRLTFEDGQTLLRNGQEVILDHIAIGDKSLNSVSIYFDGEEHSGNYVAFGEDSLSIHSTTGETQYAFFTGNPYFDVPLGEERDPTKNKILLTPAREAQITIEDRSSQNLVPLVRVASSEEATVMVNGMNAVQVRRFDYFLRTVGEPRKSAPMAIVIEAPPPQVAPQSTETGWPGPAVPVFFEGQPYLIFDGSNNFVEIRGGGNAEETQCYECLPDRQRTDLVYDMVSGQFLDLTILVESEDPEERAEVRRELVLNLLQSSADLRGSIASILVVPEERIEEFCGENAAACAFDEERRIIITAEGSANDILHHEGTHTLAFLLGEKTTKEGLLEGRTLDALLDTYGTFENIPPDVWQAARSDIEQRLGEQLFFRQRWVSIAGDVYGQHLGAPTVQGRNANTWSDGSSTARFGCFRAYGCNSFDEDVAEAVELFAEGRYELIRNLLNPQSDYYQGYLGLAMGGIILTQDVAEDWAARYRGKVELLYEYGFITEEDYQRVITP